MNQTLRKEYRIGDNNQLVALVIEGPIVSPSLIPVPGSQRLITAYLVSPDDEEYWSYCLWDMARDRQATADLVLHLEGAADFEHAVCNYRRLILTEVIKRRWDSAVEVEGVPKDLKPFIESAAEVTDSLITLIIGVFTRKPCGYIHPAQWFKKIFFENEAIGTLATTNGAVSKTTYREEIYQKANKQVNTLEKNPFSKPHTQLLFDHALDMAERVSGFRPKYFAPYVSARSQQSKILKQADLLRRSKSGGAVIARQGRKKKS